MAIHVSASASSVDPLDVERGYDARSTSTSATRLGIASCGLPRASAVAARRSATLACNVASYAARLARHRGAHFGLQREPCVGASRREQEIRELEARVRGFAMRLAIDLQRVRERFAQARLGRRELHLRLLRFAEIGQAPHEPCGRCLSAQPGGVDGGLQLDFGLRVVARLHPRLAGKPVVRDQRCTLRVVLAEECDGRVCRVACDGQALVLVVARGLGQERAAQERRVFACRIERSLRFRQKCRDFTALGPLLQRADVAENRVGAPGIGGTVNAARDLHAVPLQRDGLWSQAELHVHVRKRVEDLHLAFRCVLQRVAHARGADVEQLARGGLLRPERVRLLVGVGAEDVDHEALHRLRPLRLLPGERGLRLRLDALRARDRRLPGRDACTGEDRDQHRGRCADGDAIAQQELAQAIARAVGPRVHRIAAQMALDVLGERADAGVACGGILAQRLLQDGVEVAAQPSLRGGVLRDLARERRVVSGDRLLELGRAAALQAIRPGTGQQLERDHAERVHVARGARAARPGSARGSRSRA